MKKEKAMSVAEFRKWVNEYKRRIADGEGPGAKIELIRLAKEEMEYVTKTAYIEAECRTFTDWLIKIEAKIKSSSWASFFDTSSAYRSYIRSAVGSNNMETFDKDIKEYRKELKEKLSLSENPYDIAFNTAEYKSFLVFTVEIKRAAELMYGRLRTQSYKNPITVIRNHVPRDRILIEMDKEFEIQRKRLKKDFGAQSRDIAVTKHGEFYVWYRRYRKQVKHIEQIKETKRIIIIEG